MMSSLPRAKKPSIWKAQLDVDNIVGPEPQFQLPPDRCPRNWSRTRRLCIAYTICNVLIPITMFSTLYVGAQRQIEDKLTSSHLLVTMGVGVVNLGIAFGSLLGTPLGSLIGRRMTYIIAGVCFTALATGSAFAPTITALLAIRFFAAFLGSTALPIFNHTLSDLFTPDDRTPLTAISAVALCSTPYFGPVLGSLMAKHVSYSWIFALSAFWAGIFTLPLLFFPETDLNVVRKYEKGAKEGKTVCKVLRTQFIAKEVWQSLITPLTMLILEPIILWTTLYHAFVYGVFFILLEAYPFVFQRNFEIDLANTGLIFLAPWLGNIIGAALYFGCLQPSHNRQRRRLQSRNIHTLSHSPFEYVQVELKPESRLPGLLAGVIILSAGLLWFALTSQHAQLHYMIPAASGLFIGIGTSLFSISLSTYHTDLYPTSCSSVLTANIFVQNLVASFCPSFARNLYEDLGIQTAGLLLAGISLAGLPMVCFLWVCGGKVRSLSKRAVQDEAYIMRDVDIDFSAHDRKDPDNNGTRKSPHGANMTSATTLVGKVSFSGKTIQSQGYDEPCSDDGMSDEQMVAFVRQDKPTKADLVQEIPRVNVLEHSRY